VRKTRVEGISATLQPGPSALRSALAIDRVLARLYPSRTALHHRDLFQLLVATILSAQCTDKKVNEVTPALFARFPDAKALGGARVSEVERLVRQTGFFRQKAKAIVGAAKGVVERFDGKVPVTVAELTTLPGVGRKTANVVLGNGLGVAEGVVVDTHVKRLAYRLGLTGETDPEKIERDLMALLPKKSWVGFSNRLIRHGREVCIARRPRCSECPLAMLCPKVGVKG
jgi:endonuclease III